jgi:hypothetical protein
MALASRDYGLKKWKSYADLHAFDTTNPAIVEADLDGDSRRAQTVFGAHDPTPHGSIYADTQGRHVCRTRLRRDCPSLED